MEAFFVVNLLNKAADNLDSYNYRRLYEKSI